MPYLQHKKISQQCTPRQNRAQNYYKYLEYTNLKAKKRDFCVYTVSVSAITPCIIGGVGTVFGPIIGAAIIEPISEITNAALSHYVGLNMVVYGLILVVVIMVMPKGVIGLVKDIAIKLDKGKAGE